MSQDPVVSLLLKSPLTPTQRRAASEAFTGSANEDELQEKMTALKLPKQVMAELWDLKYAQPAQPSAEPQGPEGSAAGRFASGAWEMLNPVTIATGLYEMGRHPRNTIDNMRNQAAGEFGKAKDAFDQGRVMEAVGHTGAGLIPMVGPLAADIGEQIASGDYAGAAGRFTGLVAGPKILKETIKIPARIPAARAALEAGAARRVAEVMTPKASNQLARRMAGQAEKVAPQIMRDVAGGLSRSALQERVAAELAAAEAGLDAATDARLSARAIDTQPVLEALQAKRAAQTADAVEASQATPKTTTRASAIVDESGKPIEVTESQPLPYGKDVVPAPNQPRVSQIDQAMSEIKQLGPTSKYEPLRTMRQAYDAPAKTVYNPSLVDDFLKKSGEAKGAADVTAALRDTLAKADPVTAEANAKYALYKSAADVLKVAEEIERVKPKVGRLIMARLTGTIFGGNAGGPAGAAAGYALAPALDSLVNAGFTTKLKTAQAMLALADAVKAGDVGRVQSLTYRLTRTAAKTRVPAISAAQSMAPANNQP